MGQRVEREYKASDRKHTTDIRTLVSKNNGLTSKSSRLETSLNTMVVAPLGTINAWVTKPSRSSSSSRNLPTCWMKCDGSVINYQNSPWKGSRVPNLNGDGRFLRGGSASQVLTMQEDSVEDHTHSVSDPGHSHSDRGHSHSYKKMRRYGAESPVAILVEKYVQKSVSDSTYSTTIGRASITTNRANIRVGSMNTSNKGTETRPKNMIVEWIIKVC